MMAIYMSSSPQPSASSLLSHLPDSQDGGPGGLRQEPKAVRHGETHGRLTGSQGEMAPEQTSGLEASGTRAAKEGRSVSQ